MSKNESHSSSLSLYVGLSLPFYIYIYIYIYIYWIVTTYGLNARVISVLDYRLILSYLLYIYIYIRYDDEPTVRVKRFFLMLSKTSVNAMLANIHIFMEVPVV